MPADHSGWCALAGRSAETRLIAAVPQAPTAMAILNQAERQACEYLVALRYGVEFGAGRARQGSRLQPLPRGWGQRRGADTAHDGSGSAAQWHPPFGRLGDRTSVAMGLVCLRA
jgi:hypothetical protein